MPSNRLYRTIAFMLLFVAGVVSIAGAAVPQEGMQLWLRADAGIDLLNAEVVRWADQSGQNHHALGEIGTAPTVEYNALNGLPVLVFDGKSDFLVVPHTNGLNAGDELTIFVVYLYEKGSELNRLMQKRSNAVGIGVDGWYVAPARGAAVASARESKDLFAAGQFLAHTAVFNAKAGTLSLLQNGEVISVLPVNAPQTPNTHHLFIGKREHTAEAHFTGKIAEIIIYDRALDDKTRMQVEAYLLQKFGL
ncbi:MAG TPA: LamG domain-containing protein [Firmicutes bacterium]|jgi:hypothetical protein|nr:LamG domain-containing protein [Bacillota bacterium]